MTHDSAPSSLTAGRRFFRALAVAGALLTAAAAPAQPQGIAARLPDGRTLHVTCDGVGGPTVILEPGWSADSGAWPKVMPDVARFTRVCAYDRAGAGRSSPGPLPRDGAAIARDLDFGLRAARIAGPYVLVGHSAGGLYVRLFADRRAADVVGMVLVDPTVEHQDRRWQAVAGPDAGRLDGLIARSEECLVASEAGAVGPDDPLFQRCRTAPPDAAADRWRARVFELRELLTATSDQVERGRANYGAMPLIVLTAGRDYPPPALRVWSAMHREIAARSSIGEQRVVPGSGHLMMRDAPDVVVAAIQEVVAAARAGLKAAKVRP